MTGMAGVIAWGLLQVVGMDRAKMDVSAFKEWELKHGIYAAEQFRDLKSQADLNRELLRQTREAQIRSEEQLKAIRQLILKLGDNGNTP